MGNSLKLEFKIFFKPVKDKPGYYHFGNNTIISEEVLKKAIDEYNDKNLLVYRNSSKGDQYFFDYEFWDNGTIKKRINYKLKM